MVSCKKAALAAVAALVTASAANADVTINLGGPYVFAGGQSTTVNTAPLFGTLTGITVSLNYSNSLGGSWVQDTGVTVDTLQWGGYDMFINGATVDQGDIIGFPNNGTAGNYVGTGGGASIVYSGGSAVVGIGNAYTFAGSSMTLNDVVITLHGVNIPAPGALALLGLAGVVGGRRRRR